MKGYSTEAPRGFSHPIARYIVRRWICKVYNRKAIGVSDTKLQNPEVLLQAYKEYHNENKALLICFRHVSKSDAPILVEMLGQLVPRMYRKEEKSFQKKDPFWAHFLHGWLVLQWAGGLARWLFPKIGAIPVANQIYDKDLVRLLKNTIEENRHPIAFAPEGQVTYYSRQLSHLAGGVRHFIQWHNNKKRDVRLLPVHVHYTWPNELEQSQEILGNVQNFLYGNSKKEGIENTLNALFGWFKTLEKDLFLFIWERVLNQTNGDFQELDINSQRDRINQVIIDALEKQMDLSALSSSIIERLMRVRAQIFLSMINQSITVSQMAKEIIHSFDSGSIRDIAKSYQWLQILDVMAFYDPDYPCEEREQYSYYEQFFMLGDLVNRIRGGDIDSRQEPKGRTAHIHFGSGLHYTPDDSNRGVTAQLEESFNQTMMESYSDSAAESSTR